MNGSQPVPNSLETLSRDLLAAAYPEHTPGWVREQAALATAAVTRAVDALAADETAAPERMWETDDVDSGVSGQPGSLEPAHPGLPFDTPGIRSGMVEIGTTALTVDDTSITVIAESTGRLSLNGRRQQDRLPVTVRRLGSDVVFLGSLADGALELEIDGPPPYLVQFPGTRMQEPVDAIRVDPRRLLPAASSERVESREDFIVIPQLGLEMRLYESSEELLVLSASASPDLAGSWITFTMRDLVDGSLRTGVLPLHAAFGAAEGALQIGVWSDRFDLGFGLTATRDPAELDPEAVRWLARGALDDRTRSLFARLLAGDES